MPTLRAGGFSRHSQPFGKALAATTGVKSCSAHGDCSPAVVAQRVFLHRGLGLALVTEGSSFGWHEQKGLQNQGAESSPVSGGHWRLAPMAGGLGWDLTVLF